MTFAHAWLMGYRGPGRFAEALRGGPAPRWGLYAVLARSAIDSLLVYLPMALMGRVPPTPSYLAFIPTERYYAALVVLGPLVFLAFWLLAGAFMHVVLRLAHLPSDVDVLLNISGMITLVVGTLLAVWDWVWIAAGWGNQYALGISHLVIDGLSMVLAVVAMKRLLDVPVWLGVVLNVLIIALWMPFGIMFMRSPI